MNTLMLYGYYICPIDHWHGCINYAPFLAMSPARYVPFLTTMLQEAQYHAREELEWRGDMREGPYVFAIPQEGCVSTGLAWKQDKNGETFVFSTIGLPWLEEIAYSFGKWPLKIPTGMALLPDTREMDESDETTRVLA